MGTAPFRALRGLTLVTIFACSPALGGCSLITGADDLEIDDGTTTDTTGTTGTHGSTAHGGSGGGGLGGSGTGGSGTGGAAPTCSPPCGQNQYCEAATGTCQCTPGFLSQNGSCVPAPPGDPSTRSQDDVCNQWKNGHVVSDSSPLQTNGNECDAGSLSQAGLNDTLLRINMFRWLAGLGPTTDDPARNAGAQLCANMESWFDWNSGQSPHFPPANTKCYTDQGASYAGMSNIAWGSGHPAQAIDQFMQDNGNETTMGHRRWIVNPPLGPVGIGYWSGGGQYGNAECLNVFGMSGGGPDPDWLGVPNQGFVPLEIASWTWTFHSNLGGVAGAQVTMLSVDDNMPLEVKMLPLSQGYGEETTSWIPQGWQPQAGKTYRVTVSGVSGGDIVYDVKPVACN